MKKEKKLVKIYLMLLFHFMFLSCSADQESVVVSNNTEELPPQSTDNDNQDIDLTTLVFTPNESFFSPVGTLKANLRDKTTGNEYNKNEYYDYIYEWKALTDTIIFGIDIKTVGDLTIKPEMAIQASQDGSELLVYLDNEGKVTSLTATGSEDTYQIQDEVVFQNVTTGFHIIKLQLKSLANTGQDVGRLKNLHISGIAAKNSENVMRRYRAKAVHCKWEIADADAQIEISVHELTIASKNVDFYQPITTPFGYTGSTWDKDTQTFGGYNFSLWSYGANDPIPPIYQESHLVAVGPGLEFGSYGHEGTGVKPRGPHPYIGQDTNTQIIAVRMEPGETYNTFWSYYLSPIDGHWKLYGCGKKYNKSGQLKYLTTGAFVEVPGGAHKVRSGHQVCETHYRGWQRDVSGNWHPITTMRGTSNVTDLSARDWDVLDNKFSMQMGGWKETGTPKETLTLNSADPIPNYLQGEYIKELFKMPADFEHEKTTDITSSSAKINFSISNLGTNATAHIFWGNEEGLTKEVKWQNNMEIPVSDGANTITLENLSAAIEYMYRIRITNDQGILWSLETQRFTTL
ncbi:DUF3472 domain-containing protein [Flagellimonas pacifica]|uniref:Fibronectin type-III domain-containing protein n=1 Tax=Flagellimonas pacifica TaxID=1247520 RepID=A0A285MTE1_9FLAO|nr:DUF3472 domain-containing protein [Allomuricauda parva]SNZ00455.1 protein of unknown function [Allomuricauda parva]